MSDFNFAQSYVAAIVSAYIAKDWNKTYVSICTTYRNGHFDLGSSYIYAVAELEDGSTVDLPSVYISPARFDSPESAAAYVQSVCADIQTLKEYRTGKLLNLVAEAQELSDALELPADFINPLIVMAEQLRTNVLENKSEWIIIDDNGNGWHNEAGWVSPKLATRYTQREHDSFPLPIGGRWMGAWTQADLNDEIPL